MIPSTALVFQEHGTQVAVVTKDDRVHLQSITVNKLLDNAVEVAEGISASDRVVNNPSAALLEGDKVRIVTPAPGYDLIDNQAPSSKEAPFSKESPVPMEPPASIGSPKSNEPPAPMQVPAPPEHRTK
jgi:hypothetical protein